MNTKSMIDNMKTFLKVTRPTKNANGHKVKVLFLDDYVLYALLREKQDFTKCAHNKQQAIDIAKQYIKTFTNLAANDELSKKGNIYRYYATRLGIDLTSEKLVEILESFKKQLAKYTN